MIGLPSFVCFTVWHWTYCLPVSVLWHWLW